ncbi:MAG: hypothetical protein RL090_1305 [Bacteroidota bacterium]|jgi:16S rRNA (cytidine1402-2'-O)-methyltransferase
MTDKPGILYLIPVPLGENPLKEVLSEGTIELVRNLDLFIVENAKTARHFIKLFEPNFKLQDIEVIQLDKHSNNKELIAEFIAKVKSGRNAGLMSECGIPGVADPGSDVVLMAHAVGVRVVPMPGPSSIFLALAASGLNGQKFTFQGYLPKEKDERIRKIKDLSVMVIKEKYTHVFIETPYRNDALFQDLVKNANGELRLCIATGITTSHEFILTKRISEWVKVKPPVLKDIPCVFLLG